VKAQEHADGRDSPAEPTDHYRLLLVDPDAPHEVVAEAYWYLASRLRAEQAVRRSAERELAAINAAYQVLAVVEQRRAYDATVPRVVELRRQRAERARQQQRRGLSARLLRRPQPPLKPDYYELLRVDPEAEPPLIARAYSILRTLHSKRAPGGAPKEYLRDLAQARGVLIDRVRRAAYDEWRARPPPGPDASPATQPPTEVVAAVETPGAEQSEEPASLRWQAQVMPVLSKAFIVTAKAGGRAAAGGARLSCRGISVAARGGGRGLVAGLRAGSRGVARLRAPEGLRGPALPLPDDRLLRDVAPAGTRSRRAAAGGPRRGRLVMRGPEDREETFDLGKGPVIVGSGRDCDIRLAAEPGQVAPAHAQIWFTGERFVIRSLDPLHPTLLCGQRVNWAGLDDGDEIEIGPHRLRFEAVDLWDNPPDFLTLEPEAAASTEEISERQE
jgi:curved DNA-binding protein CbpA